MRIGLLKDYIIPTKDVAVPHALSVEIVERLGAQDRLVNPFKDDHGPVGASHRTTEMNDDSRAVVISDQAQTLVMDRDAEVSRLNSWTRRRNWRRCQSDQQDGLETFPHDAAPNSPDSPF